MQHAPSAEEVSIYCRNSPACALLLHNGNLIFTDAHSHVVAQVDGSQVEDVSVRMMHGFPVQRLWIVITTASTQWLVRPRRLRLADEATLNLVERIHTHLVHPA